MGRMRTTVAIILTLMAFSARGQAANCRESAGYEQGLCLYAKGEFAASVPVLEKAAKESTPEGARAAYFFARAEMKLENWDAASDALIALFNRSPAFFRLWNGDYLLGVCRQKSGL